MRLWQCPGPARLLSAAADALVEGRSAVLRCPALAPPEPEGELRDVLGATGWSLMRVEDDGAAPARQVLEAAWVRDALAGEASAGILLDRAELSGRVFWCVPSDAAGVRRWLSFLDDYAVACRARPDTDGPRFALSLAGALACPAPPRTVQREVFDLGAAVSQTDLLLLAYHQTGTTFGGAMKGQVIAQTAASIALWDAQLLARLLAEPAGVLFNPAGMLAAYGRELGWQPGTASWQDGSERTIGGSVETHAALLALEGDPRNVIASRVWAGQAAVLLPAIERRRFELIADHEAALRQCLPFETDFETITDVHDLQVGHVYAVLRKLRLEGPAGRALRIKKARDSLAHLEPLTPADAFAAEILGE